jgi:hypothetical protein
MQLDKTTLEIVRDISRRENRPQRDVLRKLVAEAVAARHRDGGICQDTSANRR